MGRRWGKTLMAGSMALAAAYRGASVAWVVPTYRNARPLWRFVEQHAATAGQLRRAEMSVQFARGHLTIYTADNDVGLRGEAFDLVIVDEAAQIKAETWTDVIMPTLADRDGRAMLISTPKGRNWFWSEFERGRIDGKRQAAFTAPTAANPNANIQRAAQAARARVSDRTYRQEWLAEFIADGAGVFRGVRELSCLPRTEPRPNADYIIGVDWGRRSDSSVFSVWDIGARHEAAVYRLQNVTYSAQIAELARIAAEYNDALIVAESNGIGDPLIGQAVAAGLRLMEFTTTQARKAHAVDLLALACESARVQLQADETGLAEMESFECLGYSTNGLPRYSAPDGQHDDIVMARIIGHSALAEAGPVVLWS